MLKSLPPTQQIPASAAEGLGHCLQPCDCAHILQGLLTSVPKIVSCQILFLSILKDTSQQKDFWLGAFFCCCCLLCFTFALKADQHPGSQNALQREQLHHLCQGNCLLKQGLYRLLKSGLLVSLLSIIS